jgi:hypothetical protein
MQKVNVKLFESRPLFDVASYARLGPGSRDRLSPAEIAQIARTVQRVPEAVVKVQPKGSNDLRSIAQHIDYIGRSGALALETDEGEQIRGKGIGYDVIEDWDLDLNEHRSRCDLTAGFGRSPPRLVHKLMLSMPRGTRAEGVLAAARTFLREQFALQHRYVFVLHTDKSHPHVHAVVKAVNKQIIRLNIYYATLRAWRAEFARHLRAEGIEANATERAVRGQTVKAQKDGIYRVTRRGASTLQRRRVEEIAAELATGGWRFEHGKRTLVETRKDVLRGWFSIADRLAEQDHRGLAEAVRGFARTMPPPMTDRERIAQTLLALAHEARMANSGPAPGERALERER